MASSAHTCTLDDCLTPKPGGHSQSLGSCGSWIYSCICTVYSDLTEVGTNESISSSPSPGTGSPAGTSLSCRAANWACGLVFMVVLVTDASSLWEAPS